MATKAAAGSERSERITMVTDLVLAAVAGGLSIPLLTGAHGENRARAVAWGLAFAFTAAAALAGGAFHGTRHRLAPSSLDRLWRLTLLLSAPVGFFLLASAAFGALPGSLGALLLGAAGMKLILVLLLLHRTGSFAVVAYDSGVSLIVLGLLAALSVAAGEVDSGEWWILGGVILSLIGAVIQQRGVRAGKSFDHNDLFHLVQLVACILFYQGAGQG